MTWNYRVIRKIKTVTLRPGVVRRNHFYEIHEVYYDEKGKPDKWTEEPVHGTYYESLKDLRIALSMMLCDSLKHPVLEIVGGKKKRLLPRKETP